MWRKPEFYRTQLIEQVSFTYHAGVWFLFGSARSGLAAFLSAAGIGRGDEVVVSSYTCLAVPTAIVAVGVENLASVSMQLLQYGINKILIEKPAGIFFKEITDLVKLANNNKASVFVAYNRRFYASSQKAKEIINQQLFFMSHHCQPNRHFR